MPADYLCYRPTCRFGVCQEDDFGEVVTELVADVSCDANNEEEDDCEIECELPDEDWWVK